MKLKKISMLIIAFLLVILIGFGCYSMLSYEIKPEEKEEPKETKVEEFVTNKGVTENVMTNELGIVVNNSPKFHEVHTYDTFTIDNFEFYIDPNNEELAHAKFKVNDFGMHDYPKYTINFNFIFSDGSKSEEFTPFVYDLEEEIDFTILHKVIDAVDYEFTVVETALEPIG